MAVKGCVAGSINNAVAQARLQMADVTFRRRFGQVVEAIGAGAQRRQVSLTRLKPGLQRRQALRRHRVRMRRDRQVGQRVRRAVGFLHKCPAYRTSRSSGS